MQNIANDKSEVVATRRPKPKAFSKDAADEKRFSETTNHPLGRSLARERNFLATTGMTNTRYQMETETSKVKQNFYRYVTVSYATAHNNISSKPNPTPSLYLHPVHPPTGTASRAWTGNSQLMRMNGAARFGSGDR